MPAAQASREEVVDRLLTAFRRKGYDGASLADLSTATGLGRSSLYHYFPGGKEDMARAVLDRADAWLDEQVIAPLQADGNGRDRLARMTKAMNEFYDGGRERCVLGAFVIGQSRDLFSARLAGTFERWVSAMAGVARNEGVAPARARARAEKAVIQIQGAIVLSAALADPKPFKRVLAELADELLAPEP